MRSFLVWFLILAVTVGAEAEKFQRELKLGKNSIQVRSSTFRNKPSVSVTLRYGNVGTGTSITRAAGMKRLIQALKDRKPYVYEWEKGDPRIRVKYRNGVYLFSKKVGDKKWKAVILKPEDSDQLSTYLEEAARASGLF